MCLKVLVNCASNQSNLPAFNSSFNRSDVISTVLPLTNGRHVVPALHSKMLLALINPLLNAEQLHFLKINATEARNLVSLLKQAMESTECGFSLTTMLKVFIWLSHQYQNHNLIESDDTHFSNFERQLCHVAIEIFTSNIQLLMKEGLIPVLRKILCETKKCAVQVLASRLIWCLAHNPETKAILLNSEPCMVEILQQHHIDQASVQELHLASHCALWKLGVLTCTKGNNHCVLRK